MTSRSFTDTLRVDTANSGNEQFTPWRQIDKSQMIAISVRDTGLNGGSSATYTNATPVFLQRRYTSDNTPGDVSSWTAALETDYVAGCGCEIRVGVKAAGFVTGDDLTIIVKN